MCGVVLILVIIRIIRREAHKDEKYQSNIIYIKYIKNGKGYKKKRIPFSLEYSYCSRIKWRRK